MIIDDVIMVFVKLQSIYRRYRLILFIFIFEGDAVLRKKKNHFSTMIQFYQFRNSRTSFVLKYKICSIWWD